MGIGRDEVVAVGGEEGLWIGYTREKGEIRLGAQRARLGRIGENRGEHRRRDLLGVLY